jgi:tRNA A37 threonylcarbamoyladenosine synthetase subunit TsaC/SUA5/YrdC
MTAPVTAERQQHAAGELEQQQDSSWAEARHSVLKGALVLLAAASVFGLFVLNMPRLQVRTYSVHRRHWHQQQ